MLSEYAEVKVTASDHKVSSDTSSTWWTGMLRVEWLGQTAASLCWIASVFVYGISSAGDWLQLCAATAWLVANVASLATSR